MARIRTRLGLLVVAITVIAAVVYWKFPNATDTEADRRLAEQARQFLDFSRTTDDTPIPITVGTVEMVIPANYFLGIPTPGEETRATLLEVLLPGFEPHTEENLHHFFEPGWNDRLTILAQQQVNLDPSLFTRMYQAKLENYEPLQDRGISYGLQQLRGPIDHDVRSAEDFFLPDQDRPDFIINCSLYEVVPSPSCRITLISGAMIYRISSSRAYLRDYDRIMERSILLVESFITQPPR